MDKDLLKNPSPLEKRLDSPVGMEEGLAEAVEVYHRTYTTLLRSSGETRLKILEASHKAMGASLHPLANSSQLDLGAFLYAVRRLPSDTYETKLIVMGQSVEVFANNGMYISKWKEKEAPGRRRRWYRSTDGILAVLIASPSDVDDLIPTLVAYQIEWNKIHYWLTKLGTKLNDSKHSPASLSKSCGGSEDDWQQLLEIWGKDFIHNIKVIAKAEISLKIRMLGGSQVGYSKVTRRWWQQVTGVIRSEKLVDRPVYFISSNTHSVSNLLTGIPRKREREIITYIEKDGPNELKEELNSFRDSGAQGEWLNFLYYCARFYLSHLIQNSKDVIPLLKREEKQVGVFNVSSRTALDVAAQVIPLDTLDTNNFDPRLGNVDYDTLRHSDAIIVNIDYPLGIAAYNILREVAETIGELKGVYVLGKAATLNADIGDVMISSVIHDEHSGSTYWLDNAFTVSDISPFLQFGSGLDNQRAVSVKGTFLQNRGYLDFYYRDAFTVVEMEAGPYCDAIYEFCEPGRYPVKEPVNFSKLPIDFGVIHYASDTPLTQARTLGARGLSFYGMDSTYAASIAIVRRILKLEGALD